jgi:hypothetical protein
MATFFIPLLVVEPATANDTSAELATGGLIFTNSTAVEMESEDLFISMKEIRVRYRFYNHSDRDVVTHVAFPMPDINYGEDAPNLAIPTDDPKTILNFKTTVNNRLVTSQVEQRAILNGVEQTETLRNLGVPDSSDADNAIEPLWTLKTTQPGHLFHDISRVKAS